jgi:hypothetical protein
MAIFTDSPSVTTFPYLKLFKPSYNVGPDNEILGSTNGRKLVEKVSGYWFVKFSAP